MSDEDAKPPELDLKGKSEATEVVVSSEATGRILAFAADEGVDVDTFGADGAFKWMGLALQGELYFGRAEGRSSKALLHARGGYAQAGFMVVPRHLEAAVRYSYVNPDTDRPDNSRTEYQGALSYYFSGHPLKLQGEYTERHDQALGDTVDRIYRVQAQLMF